MQLNTIFFGKNDIELNVVDSTNNYAANLINTTNVPEGTVIMAQFQSDGKGQRGNSWYSEPGKNLMCSVVVYPSFLRQNTLFLLSKAVSIALRDVIEDLTSHPTFIKWPNDIFVDYKKICGVLIENFWSGNALRSIIGIGLNVNQLFFDGNLNATSLGLLAKREFDTRQVLGELLEKMEQYYLVLRSGNYNTIEELYLEGLLQYAQSATYRIDGELVQGKIVDVKGNGQLILERVDGRQAAYDFKEIEYML